MIDRVSAWQGDFGARATGLAYLRGDHGQVGRQGAAREGGAGKDERESHCTRATEKLENECQEPDDQLVSG